MPEAADVKTGARQLSHGLRYIYTSGACAVFARALTEMPGCSGSTIVSIEDDQHDHQVVRLADGRHADAEGVRDLARIARSLGMKGDVSTKDLPAEPVAARDLPHHEALVRHLLHLGWTDGPPPYDDDDAIEERFDHAKADFDRLGGWSGNPVRALALDRKRRTRRTA